MSLIVIAALALASDPQAALPAKPVKAKLVCVESTPTGSRIPGPRICKTAEQWRADQHDYRDETERAQRLNTIHGG